LPTSDEALARQIIDRGVRADGSRPDGIVYLVRTQDAARNVRALEYDETKARFADRVKIADLTTPVRGQVPGILAYFTGTARVKELPLLRFLPGAAADHLTSFGGRLTGIGQMPARDWLRHGATGSFGTVSEPCNHLEKFPNTTIFLKHYLLGETLLEAYWKSVAMPGQGLFIGEPLARPFSMRTSP
jgi:uncharacterized protein (TIGR03790 family)